MHKTPICLLLVFCLFAINSFAQNNLVKVIASGEGLTESSATNRALRNAIEKTFGVFITSSTQVSNDELIKDEIATVSSGNIADYEVISVSKSSEMYTVSVSARISPERVVMNFKSAGKSIELKGSVYAQNVIKEKFYKEQEIIAIKDFIKIYKDFWIIDSFSTHPCSPFFKKFGDEATKWEVEPWMTGLALSEDLNHGSNYIDDFNKCKCYDGFMMDFKGNPPFTSYDLSRINYRNAMTFYFCSPIGFKGNGLFDYKMRRTKDESSENILNQNSTDISGEFHFLPVIYKAYYNSKRASVLANALTKLVMAVSIGDKEDYKEKMGQFFNFTLITAIDEKIKVGSYSTINSGDELVKIPYYETTGKSASNTFYLRNKESIELLKDYFDQQFYRANPVALKVKNFSDFSKKIHFTLRHKYLKDFADPFEEEYLSQPNRTEYTLDLTPCIPFDYKSEYNSKIVYHRALYPSILLLRFSLSDLEKIENIDFDWK
jgi:hypothetical protein